ncbi:ABC transporter related protein [Xylanimonas cellulosilytica DSM 15894]|uniref:ABC transporter related protein n=1 Tax=Xylanimonas cellulosilytica (strain DSM 15894 / JCM 12276 / CECT 5975 / KCTC 9989 / LMG 20990 / NBRC 107835 / XIL07) TaxID=446471 RepID=D1BRQ6_XYLCX|nr:ABC transporter ATP-binding protein [Xylanimonas cellulosilytica]ACZ32322.1 ABC transporter related protein [Xylanimonas cellulosilytica DSM 15894]
MNTAETPTIPPFAARLDGVTVRYGRERAATLSGDVLRLGNRGPGGVNALDSASLTLRPGVITGILGRNGAGKTTLLQLLAGYVRPTSGSVVVGPQGQEEDPWENPWTASGTQLVRESGDLMTDERVSANLWHYAAVRPDWDADLAGRLLDLFEIDTRRKPTALSRGKRSALGATIGLASRAPLTIFDEVYLGMDAPTRYAFYDEILADYAAHPRTILLSSHLVEEVERLFEDVVVLHRGRVLLAEPAEIMRERGHSLTGPAAAVDRLAAGRRVLHRQQLGSTVQVTLEGQADDGAARAAGVDVGAVPLQDLVVRLTTGPQAPAGHDAAAPKGATR